MQTREVMMGEESKTTVEVTLGDTIHVLTPKLSAMKAVNRLGGGYAGVFRALNNFDADVYVGIVAAGTGSPTGKALQELERRVYEHGIENLLVPLARFVTICAAGGKDPDSVAKRNLDEEAAAGKN